MSRRWKLPLDILETERFVKNKQGLKYYILSMLSTKYFKYWHCHKIRKISNFSKFIFKNKIMSSSFLKCLTLFVFLNKNSNVVGISCGIFQSRCQYEYCGCVIVRWRLIDNFFFLWNFSMKLWGLPTTKHVLVLL